MKRFKIVPRGLTSPVTGSSEEAESDTLSADPEVVAASSTKAAAPIDAPLPQPGASSDGQKRRVKRARRSEGKALAEEALEAQKEEVREKKRQMKRDRAQSQTVAEPDPTVSQKKRARRREEMATAQVRDGDASGGATSGTRRQKKEDRKTRKKDRKRQLNVGQVAREAEANQLQMDINPAQEEANQMQSDTKPEQPQSPAESTANVSQADERLQSWYEAVVTHRVKTQAEPLQEEARDVERQRKVRRLRKKQRERQRAQKRALKQSSQEIEGLKAKKMKPHRRLRRNARAVKHAA